MARILGRLQQTRNDVRLEYPNPGRRLLYAGNISLVLGEASGMQEAPTSHA
jgi:uncharacterized protein (DUF39 family)